MRWMIPRSTRTACVVPAKPSPTPQAWTAAERAAVGVGFAPPRGPASRDREPERVTPQHHHNALDIQTSACDNENMSDVDDERESEDDEHGVVWEDMAVEAVQS